LVDAIRPLVVGGGLNQGLVDGPDALG